MVTEISLSANNEADVEQKIIYPLLTSPNFLAIPADAIRAKSYLAPSQLDKDAGRKAGYFPDFSVWIRGFPVLIVEAKDPTVPVETGFREACLYARHLNAAYSTDLNPCRYVVASNGKRLLVGYWDQAAPAIDIPVADLNVGAQVTQQLVEFCSARVLEAYSINFVQKIRPSRGVQPFNLAGGQALLNAKEPLNTFAAELSPVLRRYFASTAEEDNREIVEVGYVSSAETTEYDRILEAMLKDRTSPRRDTIVQTIQTSRRDETSLTKALQEYKEASQHSGQLQIIQGSVGSGKSLFARRYRLILEPPDLKAVNHWAFIDFNSSPPSLKGAERWLCEAFNNSFIRENAGIAIYDGDIQKGIFSREIQKRKAYYESLRSISMDEETRARAQDIVGWQSDPCLLAESIAHYIMGVTRNNLVVVMDNVDKMNLENQLDAFQLTLWFMARTKAFLILQMRDETYERYKNRPPLDTFRTGITFHIAPPRFVDVVRRRLDLAISYLTKNASEKQEIILDNSVRLILPKGELGNFLKVLYSVIFGRRGNVSRILEALAGKDVRKALEMFVSIVTSGHLTESTITSNVRGEGAFPITEHHIVRILMRTDYRFFSDNNPNVSNIFYYDNDWSRPDNFLLIEVLFFLCRNRKRTGEIGLEGYFSLERICGELQKSGYDRGDVSEAANYLLRRQLIVADNFNTQKVEVIDCVKIQASGFIHLRILCERLEYLHGVIPVIPISDNATAAALADYVNRESQRGRVTAKEKARAVEILLRFLKHEMGRLREKNPFFNASESGAVYVLKSMDRALGHFYRTEGRLQSEQDQLDF